MKTPNSAIPDSAIRIETYAELKPWIGKFREEKYNCLTVLSSPGQLKTTMLTQIVGREDDTINPGEGVWIEGNDSAFTSHCRIWEKMADPRGPQRKLLVIDDVEEWTDPRSRKYLKALLNTEPIKWLPWDTAATRRLGVPGKYPVSCKVCWLANEYHVKTINGLAIFERGICIYFNPTPAELHAEILRRGTFKDQVILDFIAEYMRWIVRPTARYYYHANEIKDAGQDWRGWLFQQWFGADKALIGTLKIQHDPAFRSNTQRAAEFVRLNLGCERTFYNKLRELEGVGNNDATLHTPAGVCKTASILPLPEPNGNGKKRSNTDIPKPHIPIDCSNDEFIES